MQSFVNDALLVKVLGVVESSLAEYEKLTGRQIDNEASVAASPKSFSGYTMALLEAVAKMSVYVKEVICHNYLLYLLLQLLQICNSGKMTIHFSVPFEK